MKDTLKSIIDSLIASMFLILFGYIALAVLWAIHPLLAVAFLFSGTYLIFRKLREKSSVSPETKTGE